MKIKFDSNHEYHFVGVGKMIAGGKGGVPKMKPDEKNANGLLGDKK